MAKHEGVGTQLLSAPQDFLHGLIGGLLGPLLVLAGAMGLLFALTRKLPAIREVVRSNGQRERAVVLAPRAEALATWSSYGGELQGAWLRLRAARNSRPRG